MSSELDIVGQLDWIPLYIDRLLASQRFRLMADYERGWYISLIVESVRSERVGYLKLDGQIYRLAGARNRAFFDANCARVMACFEREEIDGQVWVFSERLVRTVREQLSILNKHRRRTDQTNGNVIAGGEPNSFYSSISEGFDSSKSSSKAKPWNKAEQRKLANLKVNEKVKQRIRERLGK